MPPAVHFEAKLYALRKSKDGLIVSFVVHPNDTPNDLITAPIGEQYIVALAPYVESPSASDKSSGRNGSLEPEAGGGLSPKERYARMEDGEQAVTRSGILAQDPVFRQWCQTAYSGLWRALERRFANHEGAAAEFIREACQVSSRAEIATNPKALQRFLGLETEYLMATGKMASPS